MEKKKGTKAKRTERNVYMAIIIILALYGLRDSFRVYKNQRLKTMFSKLSKQTKTQEIEKPQSFASQLAEATKLFTDAVSKLKNISSGVSKKMEENDAKIKSLSVENIALQELKNKADKQAEQLNRLIQS